jgi:hypothetical protein
LCRSDSGIAGERGDALLDARAAARFASSWRRMSCIGAP